MRKYKINGLCVYEADKVAIDQTNKWLETYYYPAQRNRCALTPLAIATMTSISNDNHQRQYRKEAVCTKH